MLSSALSTIFVLTVSVHGASAQLVSKDRAVWRSIEPAVVCIVRGKEDVGTAALVDTRGTFVSYLGSVYGKRVTARLSDGRIVTLTLKSSDDPTQLAVLQADDWIKSARPLAVVADGLSTGDRLLAVLPSGSPISAEYVGAKKGLVARHLMPLSEINFEEPSDIVGGALIVTPQGDIVGFLDATLHSNRASNEEPEEELGVRAKPNLGDTLERVFGKPRKRRYGPADMTTAYTIAPNVFQRTMDALISGRGVDRPSIGVEVVNAPGGGALIEDVLPGSSAEEAGLKRGDVVFQINNRPIDNQLALGNAIMDAPIGATLKVMAKRGRTTLIVPVRVGSRAPRRAVNPEGST